MITVYGIQSTNVARVRAALLKKDLDFQHISVDMANRSEEFKKLTPIGKIPVIDDDGTRVWDSVNIMKYLDEKYPDTYRLFPKEPEKLAKVLNIIAIIEDINSYLMPLVVEKYDITDKMRKSGKSYRAFVYDESQKKDLQNDIDTKFALLKDMLDGDYFTDKLTAADILLASSLLSMQWYGLKISGWEDWHKKLAKDPAIANMFASKEEKGIKEI